MNSKLAFLIPLVSLLYFIDTIRNKRLNRILKILLGIFSLTIVVVDFLIAAVFYVNCWDAMHQHVNYKCIGWIYPTLDFKILIILLLVIFTFSIFGLIKRWPRQTYFYFGSIIIYAGTTSMIMLLNGAKNAISLGVGTNTSIILDVFSIAIVYGIIASLFYLGVFFLGLFTKYTPRQKQV